MSTCMKKFDVEILSANRMVRWSGVSRYVLPAVAAVGFSLATLMPGHAADDSVAAPATEEVAVAAAAPAPIPLARPVRPGEVPLSTVAALAQDYDQFENALMEAGRSSLGTPREVRRLISMLKFEEPQAAAQSWLAHRGLIAAQDPAFVAGVKAAVSSQGAGSVLAQLSGRGDFARSIEGAGSAIQSVMSAISSDNARMAELHDRFLSTAQQFQTQRWGMLEDRDVSAPTDFAMAEEADTLELGDFSPISTAHAAYAPPVMERILAYGARHVIDTDLEQDVSSAAPVNDDNARRCLTWAKLNLNQCVAAAHFPSEEAWCAGKHAVEEVRSCWANALPRSER